MALQESLGWNSAAWGDLSIWGTLRARQGRMEEAIAKWQAAEKLNPAATDPYVEWGNVLYSQGNYSEALKKHQQALRLNPHSENLRASVAQDLKDVRRSRRRR